MQCGSCGFARPGSETVCPSCGRAFLKAPAPAPLKAPRAGSGLVRVAVYGALGLALWHSLAPLCSAYVDAEQERVESALLSQNLERKKAMRAAEQGLD